MTRWNTIVFVLLDVAALGAAGYIGYSRGHDSGTLAGKLAFCNVVAERETYGQLQCTAQDGKVGVLLPNGEWRTLE